ncbi:MAG: hypothetical protein NVSMB44_11950 [Ktedonobacteraceae bacterium]
MANYSKSVKDTKEGEASIIPVPENASDEPASRFANSSVRLLDGIDAVVYVIVGACFFLWALFALGYSFWEGYRGLLDSGADAPKMGQAIIQFISDLLLVLIIMEVLGTVTHYLKERATSLRPFLFIGIISATRGILSIGARLSVEGSAIRADEFQRAMIELGVNGAVILALGITIKLLGNLVEE